VDLAPPRAQRRFVAECADKVLEQVTLQSTLAYKTRLLADVDGSPVPHLPCQSLVLQKLGECGSDVLRIVVAQQRSRTPPSRS